MESASEDQLATYERQLAAVTIGAPERLSGRVELAAYDADWPWSYQREAASLRAALGARALRVEHVGSTAVPGLAAKPVVDVVLEVADAAAEPAYRADLEAVGFVLRIREPGWFEHRLFARRDGAVGVHVFSAGCPEIDRMVAFRDRLRANSADRDRYARVKRDLASREWAFVQQYADAKTDVISSILTGR
jgi:GrpB-like predicted nucleotidyltransferase (UPF0157 family)